MPQNRGDTKPLDKALSDVNKTSKNLQSELRKVEKLLKLDPTNTELLAQNLQSGFPNMPKGPGFVLLGGLDIRDYGQGRVATCLLKVSVDRQILYEGKARDYIEDIAINPPKVVAYQESFDISPKLVMEI